MASLRLVIGNKNYSSWSLRAWLFLRWSGLEFEEVRVPLFRDGWRQELARYTPASRVPVLFDGELNVWDSAAICDHLRELFPSQALPWPADPAARAECRSISAEMHAGFLAIREQLPMNIRTRTMLTPRGELALQVERIIEIWRGCRERFGHDGPWLFGMRSPADAMYAPMALRFVSYGIEVPEPARSFVPTVFQDPDVREWIQAAEAEEERWPEVDELASLEESELSLG